MKLADYPLSCFTEAARTTAGGAIAFFLGLVGGSIIVFSQGVTYSGSWSWFLIAWLALIPFTIAKLWGLLLAPILAALLIGLVWKDWNRAICGSAVAVLLSTTTFVCARHNPFANSAISFFLTMGLALLILGAGIAWEILNKRSHSRSHVNRAEPNK